MDGSAASVFGLNFETRVQLNSLYEMMRKVTFKVDYSLVEVFLAQFSTKNLILESYLLKDKAL